MFTYIADFMLNYHLFNKNVANMIIVIINFVNSHS